MMKDKITEAKEKHRKEMDKATTDITVFTSKNGYEVCDYLLCKIRRQEYHRGAWNALNELEKSL
jgi:hypothetical protein